MSEIKRFNHIKTLEEAQKVCKLAFGPNVEILTKTVEEMNRLGLRVRNMNRPVDNGAHILNEFETNSYAFPSKDLQFAMAVIYDEPYFKDLDRYLHDECYVKPFNEIGTRVAFYRANHKEESEQ